MNITDKVSFDVEKEDNNVDVQKEVNKIKEKVEKETYRKIKIDLVSKGLIPEDFDELKIPEFVNNNYVKIKSKSIGSQKQELNGSPYVNKKDNDNIKRFIGCAIGVAAIVLAINAISLSNKYDAYENIEIQVENDAFKDSYSNQLKMKEYHKENEPNVLEKIEKVKEIKEQEKELTGDYGLFSGNKKIDDAAREVGYKDAKEEIKQFLEDNPEAKYGYDSSNIKDIDEYSVNPEIHTL